MFGSDEGGSEDGNGLIGPEALQGPFRAVQIRRDQDFSAFQAKRLCQRQDLAGQAADDRQLLIPQSQISDHIQRSEGADRDRHL